MAEEAEDAGEDGEGEEDAPKKGKKKLIIMVVGLLVLGGGGYFGASAMGLIGGPPPIEMEAGKEAEPVTPKTVVYHDMEPMIVNLISVGSRKNFLKVKVALEFNSQEAVDAIQPFMPRVQDLFQIYLRTLRASDLEGSAGLFRLKEELLKRLNLAVQPSHVNSILFKEIIVQ